MSRMVFTPVSGSLFQTTRRMVTLSGTAYVMPRSWHSSTSYFSFIATVWPQMSQTSPRAWLAMPQRGQSTSWSPYGSATSVAPQFLQGFRRWCRPESLPHLHSQLPIEYSMNSSDEFSRKSDRKSTRLNSSHSQISYAVFCLKKNNTSTTTCVTVACASLEHSH